VIRRSFFAAVLAALASCAALPVRATDPPAGSPAGPLKVKPYTLVRFKADVPDRAAVVWRVNPSKGVQRASAPRGALEFVAPPGTYVVERLTIRTGPDGAVEVDEWVQEVQIESGCEPVPPAPPQPPPEPKRPKANPFDALGRIQFGSAGCTATVVWPRRADGRWDVLTAEHCVDAVPVGARGVMQLRGRAERFNVKVVAKDARSDVAWLVTESAELGELPFAVLAGENARPGVRVWHAGFGVDNPGNREDGEVTRADSGTGKAEMVLSVSSGDSGGGIFRADTGELIGTVCCTTRKGARVPMYGGNVESIRKLRPQAVSATDDWWTPLDVPIHGATSDADWWTPLPARECDGPTVIDLRARK